MMLEVFETKLIKASPARAREARELRAKLATATANVRNLAKGFYPVEIENRPMGPMPLWGLRRSNPGG